MQETKRVHLNTIQQLAYIVFARVMVAVCGRGMGKTKYITSLWLLNNLLRMPRCGGGLLIPSYAGMSKITSKIYEGWEMMGYREWNAQTGGHYVIGKKPPEIWPIGYNAPREREGYKNYVTFYNGAGFYYLSSKSAHNGSDLDFLGVEEGKLIKGERYREIALAVRGNESVFSHLGCHGSRLVVSDMPRMDEGDEDWYLSWKQEHNQDNVDKIIACHKHLNYLYQSLEKWDKPGKRKRINYEINMLTPVLEHLRKNTTCYIEADSLQNIMALGFDYFVNIAKDLDGLDLLTSVLNYPVKRVKGGFYGMFNEAKHGYTSAEIGDYTDCRKDSDIRKDMPIDIACDYNNAICVLLAGQRHGDDYKTLNELIVESPKFITDLAREFVKYYEAFPKKIVNYHYDATALQGRNALSNKRYYEEFVAVLRLAKWQVNMYYHSKVITHNDRYKFWNKMHRGAMSITFSYNVHNCKYLPISLGKAGTLAHRDGSIGKDKRPELNKKIDQKTTTHISEALDSLVCGQFYDQLETVGTSSLVDVM
jgi:hypothetical protein